MTEFFGSLYYGHVMHRRLRPKKHRFSYRVFSMFINLDKVDDLSANMKFFSRNRFNLFSFHERDFGDGSQNLRDYIRDLGAQCDCDISGKIMLLFYPRMLGFAFNPIATFYCYDRNNRLSAINHEVRNTFGGKHSYFAPVNDEQESRYSADKKLHVSPFMHMSTRYHFRLNEPDEEVLVAIRQTDKEGSIFNAVFTGKRKEITDKTLLSSFVLFPLMTLKIIFAIHWEAVRLFLKGMRLLPSPETPASMVSFIGSGRSTNAKHQVK